MFAYINKVKVIQQRSCTYVYCIAWPPFIAVIKKEQRKVINFAVTALGLIPPVQQCLPSLPTLNSTITIIKKKNIAWFQCTAFVPVYATRMSLWHKSGGMPTLNTIHPSSLIKFTIFYIRKVYWVKRRLWCHSKNWVSVKKLMEILLDKSSRGKDCFNTLWWFYWLEVLFTLIATAWGNQ